MTNLIPFAGLIAGATAILFPVFAEWSFVLEHFTAAVAK